MTFAGCGRQVRRGTIWRGAGGGLLLGSPLGSHIRRPTMPVGLRRRHHVCRIFGSIHFRQAQCLPGSRQRLATRVPSQSWTTAMRGPGSCARPRYGTPRSSGLHEARVAPETRRWRGIDGAVRYYRFVWTRSLSMPRNSTNEVMRFHRKSPYWNGVKRFGESIGNGAIVTSARVS